MHSLAEELNMIDLGDQRLNCRARRVPEALYRKPGSSISAACGGWSEVKGAYRFFEQESVTAQQLLEPHYQTSAERMAAHAVVLCVQDTTELDYTGMRGEGPALLNIVRF